MTRPPLAHAAVLAAALALAGCADPVVSPTSLPEGAPSGSLQGTQDVEAAAGGAAAKRGTITVSLVMRPEGPADVAFTTDSRTLRSFTLDDDADPALDNAVTFRNVKPGPYAIQMASAPDGPLTAIRCTSTGGTDNNAVDVDTRTATLNVEAGEAVACTFIDGWESGDVQSRNQIGWDESTDWFSAYSAIYASTFGTVEVGLPGATGFSLRFTTPTRITNFLVQTAAPAVLNADHVDGTSSSSGQFGGETLALRLNVDFAAAGVLGGTTALGGMMLCDMPDATLNGKTVTEVLGLANTLLGGGTNGYTVTAINATVAELNRSFLSFYNLAPTQWAQEHLAVGACP